MKNVLILERSSQNLKKVSEKGKTTLEGVFAEFGVENRNGRVYEEREYLPHLEYLKKDLATGSLLGELDHPERFEVALSNVSHRVTDLWYDQNARQIKGRIEILEGTPKGQIAKSLLDAGIPLSISSRAAGTVNEDKTVSIQQIYTYDLVAKPGFEKAQLEAVNESVKARLQNQLFKLNESYSKFEESHKNLTPDLGIINENVSIFDVSDKYPGEVSIREEAKELVKNKSEKKMEKLNEEKIQQWTLFFKKELGKTQQRLKAAENAILESKRGKKNDSDIKKLRESIEDIKKVHEQHLKWTSDVAKALNKVANHSQTLAEKSNQHYGLTKKMTEVVDHNAKVLNHTQDWVGNNAEVTNAIAETVDHNADMLNKINEWNTEIAKGVNALHEWGTEKAKAINSLNERTESVAKNLNITSTWAEEMFGRAMSKQDAKKLLEYIELVSESKASPKLKKKINEMLNTNTIKNKDINESGITGIKGMKGLGVITDVKTTGNEKVDTEKGKEKGVEFDNKYKTITSKGKKGTKPGGAKPKGIKTLDGDRPKVTLGKNKLKGIMTLDTHKSGQKPTVKITGEGPTPKMKKDQKLKLDTKPVGKLKESVSKRRSKLDEKLGAIITKLEKEKAINEQLTKEYPFLGLLTEGEINQFRELHPTHKQKVARELSKNPTTDAGVIRKLWESALTEEVKDETPLWLKAAPKKYKDLYESASDPQKEAIKARAEFYELNTQYQINNFWETSGLNNKPISLNEVYTAKTPNESEQKFDSYVQSVADYMKRFN